MSIDLTAAPVCVTGGSGFLGSWCVKMLLDRGSTVHVTTRKADKAQYLMSLDGAKERLKLFEGCDLLQPGSFDSAITGCCAVLHTASPFFMQGGTEDLLVTPAVEGTKNVLDACQRLGVKGVTLTSSTASVYCHYGTLPAEHIFTAADWSDEAKLREKENWYCLSKVKAEKAAWELANAPGCTYKLAVLNPCWILGPMQHGQPHLNTSSDGIAVYMDGTKKAILNETKAVVDVRNVAEAHIAPFITGKGWGERFLLMAGSPHWHEVAKVIRSCAPTDIAAKVPTSIEPAIGAHWMGGAPPGLTHFDASPSEQQLGIKYYSVKEMVAASVETLLKNNLGSHEQYIPGK